MYLKDLYLLARPVSDFIGSSPLRWWPSAKASFEVAIPKRPAKSQSPSNSPYSTIGVSLMTLIVRQHEACEGVARKRDVLRTVRRTLPQSRPCVNYLRGCLLR